jgi:chaperonin GroES
MSFRPLYDQILVKRDKPEDRYGSIIIPDSAREDNKTVTGVVFKTGRGISNHINGRWHEPCVKPGDKVLFGNKYAGNEIELEGTKYIVMREDDLAAVLEP